jgi:hypothetical protein
LNCRKCPQYRRGVKKAIKLETISSDDFEARTVSNEENVRLMSENWISYLISLTKLMITFTSFVVKIIAQTEIVAMINSVVVFSAGIKLILRMF